MSTHIVRGDDPILRADAVDALVDELLAGDDRTLALEDHSVPGRAAGEDADGASGADARAAEVAAVVQAAQSPPFMTAVRVVVLRDIGNLAAGDLGPLRAYLDDPLETTELVLVAGGGKVPDALTKALRAAKATEHSVACKVADVLRDALAAADLDLRPDAVEALTNRVGDEAGRVPAIVEVLVSAYGSGARLGAEDVEPYLGEAGGVAPYLLTNAIERGDVAGALETLHRLLTASGPQQPKPMHPLQVLAMLHNWVRRLARLDDARVRTTADAVAALGGRVKEFPARKALEQSQRLGSAGIREAYLWIARADLDLKGERAIPEDAVMEVLVARLAAQSGRDVRRSGGRWR